MNGLAPASRRSSLTAGGVARPAEQAHIVQLLVERVEIAEDELDIQLRTDGLAGLGREFGVDARAAA